MQKTKMFAFIGTKKKKKGCYDENTVVRGYCDIDWETITNVSRESLIKYLSVVYRGLTRVYELNKDNIYNFFFFSQTCLEYFFI